MGENFWQFRPYRPEDGSRRIDWRRSARGDRFFVRERELENAQNFFLWLDPRPDFDWHSSPGLPTKRERGALLLLALAGALHRGGERVTPLLSGNASPGGAFALDQLAIHLFSAPPEPPFPQNGRGAYILVSDFYEDPSVWRSRLKAFQARNRKGILVAIADPTEVDFPFAGRLRFSAPGGGEKPLVERAETLAPAYRAAFAERRAAIRAIAGETGFEFAAMRADEPAAPALARIAALVRGPR